MIRSVLVTAWWLGMPLVPVLATWAGQAEPSPEVGRLGPQVGDPVPEFALPDQRGRIWSLKELMGPEGLMLVFNRSADW